MVRVAGLHAAVAAATDTLILEPDAAAAVAAARHATVVVGASPAPGIE